VKTKQVTKELVKEQVLAKEKALETEQGMVMVTVMVLV